MFIKVNSVYFKLVCKYTNFLLIFTTSAMSTNHVRQNFSATFFTREVIRLISLGYHLRGKYTKTREYAVSLEQSSFRRVRLPILHILIEASVKDILNTKYVLAF